MNPQKKGHPGLSILIPAAGASDRLGRPKQLVEYRGVTLIQRTVDKAFAIGPGEVIVVTGCQANAVQQAVHQTRVRWVLHPNWSRGMGTSIAAGAARVSPQSNSLMVLFCDQWRVGKEDLERLMETWQSEPERIVCARAEGRNMPPVIFPSRYFSQLQALNGRRGAHSLLADHASRLTPVFLKNAAFDLDTKDDLDDLKSHEL